MGVIWHKTLDGAIEDQIDPFQHCVADDRRIHEYEHSTLSCGGQRGSDAQKSVGVCINGSV
jgi:hypothetical protein